jgi:hypothetical protein
VSVDVRFDTAQALAEFDKEARRVTEALEHRGEELRAQLKEARDFRAADIVKVTDADAVVVIDFDSGGSRGEPGINRIGLSFEGGWGRPPVELTKPLAAGRYRAVILVSRVKV